MLETITGAVLEKMWRKGEERLNWQCGGGGENPDRERITGIVTDGERLQVNETNRWFQHCESERTKNLKRGNKGERAIWNTWASAQEMRKKDLVEAVYSNIFPCPAAQSHKVKFALNARLSNHLLASLIKCIIQSNIWTGFGIRQRKVTRGVHN